jgi:hypothetical protein
VSSSIAIPAIFSKFLGTKRLPSDLAFDGFRGSFCGLRTVRTIESSRLKNLIEEFATYERLSAVIREQQLRQDRYGTRPKFRILIVEVDPQPAGYALFFDCYASFQGRAAFSARVAKITEEVLQLSLRLEF